MVPNLGCVSLTLILELYRKWGWCVALRLVAARTALFLGWGAVSPQWLPIFVRDDLHFFSDFQGDVALAAETSGRVDVRRYADSMV